MKNITGDPKLDIRSFNLVSTLLAIINTNDESDSNVFLARHILENLEHLDEISIYDLAEQCYVSRSSLQRFFKTIGFDSFANLKASIPMVLNHNQRFNRFVQQQDFVKTYHDQTLEMMANIEALANSVHMDYFIDLIYNAKRIVFNYAAYSTIAPIAFQEAMIANGKVIRCVTNATKSEDLFNTLEEFDLLVTLSTTGNYALVTQNDIKDVKAFKVLFTMNYLDKFKSIYDRVIYLSKTEASYDFIRDGMRDAYTIQGFDYLFSLLLEKYLQKYGNDEHN